VHISLHIMCGKENESQNVSCDLEYLLNVHSICILFGDLVTRRRNCLSFVHNFPITCIYVHVLKKTKKIFHCFRKDFVGISLENPHETSLVHLENRGV